MTDQMEILIETIGTEAIIIPELHVVTGKIMRMVQLHRKIATIEILMAKKIGIGENFEKYNQIIL